MFLCDLFRFSAYLTAKDPSPGGVSTLSIVETNAFKAITHISLQARVGTDAVVKRYLAGRLQQSQTALSRAAESLQGVRAENGALNERLAMVTNEANRLRNDTESREAGLRVSHADELLRVRQEADSAIKAIERSHNAASNEQREAYETRLAGLTGSLDEARVRISSLSMERANLEAQLRETQTTLAGTQAQLESARASLSGLRDGAASGDAERVSLARELTAVQMRLAVAETSLREKETVAARTSEALAAAEAGRASQEEALGLYKAAVAKQQSKLEACVSEINRGNGLIGKLQDELKSLKGQLKAHKEANKAMENTASEAAAASESLQRESHQLRNDLERERAAKDTLQATIDSLKAQLSEAKEALQHNQQVIAWLNRELTEAQAAATGGGISGMHYLPSSARLAGVGMMGMGMGGSPPSGSGAGAATSRISTSYHSGTASAGTSPSHQQQQQLPSQIPRRNGSNIGGSDTTTTTTSPTSGTASKLSPPQSTNSNPGSNSKGGQGKEGVSPPSLPPAGSTATADQTSNTSTATADLSARINLPSLPLVGAPTAALGAAALARTGGLAGGSPMMLLTSAAAGGSAANKEANPYLRQLQLGVAAPSASPSSAMGAPAVSAAAAVSPVRASVPGALLFTSPMGQTQIVAHQPNDQRNNANPNNATPPPSSQSPSHNTTGNSSGAATMPTPVSALLA